MYSVQRRRDTRVFTVAACVVLLDNRGSLAARGILRLISLFARLHLLPPAARANVRRKRSGGVAVVGREMEILSARDRVREREGGGERGFTRIHMPKSRTKLDSRADETARGRQHFSDISAPILSKCFTWARYVKINRVYRLPLALVRRS